MSERVDAWLAAACADAERRGLPELKPLLEGLARSTEALRIADAELTSECRRSRRRPLGTWGGRHAGPSRTMSPDLRQIVDVAPLVQSGAVSPVTLVEACLEQIGTRPEINAFIERFDRQALAEARTAEREIRSGGYRGPLHGIPVSVKDLIDVAGAKTTAGSALPATEAHADAPAVANLRAAGAIIIGKTNLHEFAFGTTSEESAFGPVRNPIDPSRSAGGSSGGAAAALAAGMCFGALGTDTGGSIRIPSAACGTVGLKATIGEISCEGVVPLSTSFDHLGPMARTVADAALLFDVLNGRPPRATDPKAPLSGGKLVLGVSAPLFLRSCRRRCDRHSNRRAAACVTPDIPSGTLPSITPGRRRMSTCTSCCPRHRGITRACSSDTPACTPRASASGWKWDAISSRRTTRARCVCGQR